MQHPVLSPLRIAWLAHMEFYVNRVAPMLQHAQEALRLAPPKHHCALFGASNLREAVRAMMKVGSTRTCEAGISTALISWFVPVLAGPIADGRFGYQQAQDLFAANIADAETQGLKRLLVRLLVDAAWYKFKPGALDEARPCVERRVCASQVGCDPDDLTGAYARSSTILEALDEADRAERSRKLSNDALSTHRAAQGALLEQFLLAIPDRTGTDG
jgi:hypothetical protein